MKVYTYNINENFRKKVFVLLFSLFVCFFVLCGKIAIANELETLETNQSIALECADNIDNDNNGVLDEEDTKCFNANGEYDPRLPELDATSLINPNLFKAQFGSIEPAPDVPQGGGFVAPDQNQIAPELQEDDIRVLTLRVVNYTLTFLGLLAVVVIIYGGLLMVLSRGEEEVFSKGKTAVTYALIGILVVLLAFTLVNFVIDAARFDNPRFGGNGGTIQLPDGSTIPVRQPILSSAPQVNIDTEINGLQALLDQLQNNINSAQGIDSQSISSLNDLQSSLDSLSTRLPGSSNTQGSVQNINNALEELRQLEAFGSDLSELQQQQILSSVGVLDREIQSLGGFLFDVPLMQAVIFATPSEGSSPLSVVFDGRGSIDPTNTTIADRNYRWSYFDTNGSLVVLPSGSIVEHTFDVPGKYVVQLQVESSFEVNGQKGAIDGIAFVNIFVNPPTADVEFSINGQVPFDIYKVTLDEATSGLTFDPSFSQPSVGRRFVRYDWNFGDNSFETFENNSPVIHSYNAEGDYRVTLTTTDDLGQRNTRIVFVRVQGVVAVPDITPEDGTTLNTYVFDAERSSTEEGQIVGYQWGVSKNGEDVIQSDRARFEYQFAEPGEYDVRLTVTDSIDRTDTVSTKVLVNSQDPIAFFTAENVNDYTPSTRLFDASNSFDRDTADTIFFSWDFNNDGLYEIEKSEEKTVNYSYNAVGVYDAVLKVEDEFGKFDEFTRLIEINSLLDVDFSASRFAAQVEEAVVFTAESDTAETYYWDFGDGVIEQTDEVSITHAFRQEGVYNITLTGVDDDGNETSVTKRIFIGSKESPVAVIKATVSGREVKVLPDVCGPDKDGLVLNRTESIFLDGGLSVNIDGTDRGLTYSWDLGDEEFATGKRVTHRYRNLTIDDECYEVELVVRDRLTSKLDRSEKLYIRVANRLPNLSRVIIRPDPNQRITPVDVPVEVAGANDFDGRIVRYRFWYYYAGSDEKFGVKTVSRPLTTLTVTPRGFEGEEEEVFFAVEIIDNDGGSISNLDLGLPSESIFIVNGVNIPPEVEIITDRTTISTGDALNLFADARDPQGQTLTNDSFAWDFDGDGKFDDTTTGPQVTRVFNLPGEYEIRVRVTSNGLSTTDRHTIFVDQITDFPRAAFLFDVNDFTVNFDAQNSQFDPTIANNRLFYSWDFDITEDSDGDGVNDNDVDSTNVRPQYSYQSPGRYNVKLTVTDILNIAKDVTRVVEIGDGTPNPDEIRTLTIESNSAPLTTLDLIARDGLLKIGETTIIEATILNGDGRTYSGDVSFEILEGNGIINPSREKALNSKAKALFEATDSGTVKLRVTANNTINGNISEDIFIEVQ